jgi:hypothetical protein
MSSSSSSSSASQWEKDLRTVTNKPIAEPIGRPLTRDEQEKLARLALKYVAAEMDATPKPKDHPWTCATELCDFVNFGEQRECAQCKVPRQRDSITKTRLTKLVTTFHASLKGR